MQKTTCWAAKERVKPKTTNINSSLAYLAGIAHHKLVNAEKVVCVLLQDGKNKTKHFLRKDLCDLPNHIKACGHMLLPLGHGLKSANHGETPSKRAKSQAHSNIVLQNCVVKLQQLGGIEGKPDFLHEFGDQHH
jgi:hypothetical protein